MRVGTRSSPLALAQTKQVLAGLPAGAEVVTTDQLRLEGVDGERLADKRRWVAALEQALLAGRIDLAVHSAKDLPSGEREGLRIGCVLRRGPAADVLICPRGRPQRVAELPAEARIGTGSLRRAAQLRALRADLIVEPLAGNVDTRLQRLEEGRFDGIVLAQAGLERLGYHGLGTPFAVEEVVPAPGQGAIVVQVREGEREVEELLRPLHDPQTAAALAAERAVAAALGADCASAVGIHARLPAQDRLELYAWVGLPDGSVWLRDRLDGPLEGAAAVGQALAKRLLASGGQALIKGERPDG